jgi:hypothetical protein
MFLPFILVGGILTHYSTLCFFLFGLEGKRSHVDGATTKAARTNASSARANKGYSSRPIFSILFPISVYCTKWVLLGRFRFLSLNYIRKRNVIGAE